MKLSKDFSLIQTKGKKAIGDFLQKLQVYKSLGDIESASKMFDHYSTVSDNLEYPYLKFRDICEARKKPRRMFVQSSTQVANNNVQLKTFEATHEGLIQSFHEHFSGEPDIEFTLLELWKKDAPYFN